MQSELKDKVEEANIDLQEVEDIDEEDSQNEKVESYPKNQARQLASGSQSQVDYESSDLVIND